jgi:AraC family transcriptional activator of pobA
VQQHIPTFYLYGEPHRQVDEGFVHVEGLDDRSRPSEWTIEPHAHAELSHIFFISSGGGVMEADGTELHFLGPCLLLVPATTVHGFRWLEESTGAVITMSMRYVAQLALHEPDLAGLFSKAAAAALTTEDTARVKHIGDEMRRELSWSAVGRRAAVDAGALSLMVLALRNIGLESHTTPRPGNHVAIVARLRERIEQRFRLREPVAVHAAALGVSQTALRVACAKVASSSPSRMLDQRTILEARRALLYSNLPVTKIAFSLGFSDAAYFSRFFQRHLGMSPRSYRKGDPG